MDTNLIKHLESLTKSTGPESPRWLKDIRNDHWNRVKTLGIPSIKDEEWKYTNMSSLAKSRFSFSDQNKLKEKGLFSSYCDDDICMVFVNGHFSPELSKIDKLPKGIEIIPLKDATQKHEAGIKALFDRYKTETTTSFVSLNHAFVDNGAFVQISKNTVSDKIIHICHVTSSSDSETLSFPRTMIHVEKSAEVTILESHLSFSDEIVYFANALTDIFLGENATLHYCKSQKESLKSFHIGNTRVWQERNSNFDSLSIAAGGHITRNNLDIVLDGEGSNSTLNGLYILTLDQHIDNHTSVDHRFPNCTSNQLYKGILKDASRAVFNGKIFVQPIAQKTNSYQLNKNLLLGDKCRVDTKPQLEIFADDVKCTHGATVGQLDENQLFYLQTRCIDRQTAVKMLAVGFINDLLEHFENRTINEKIHRLLCPAITQL